MKESEYQGDQIFGPDVPDFEVHPLLGERAASEPEAVPEPQPIYYPDGSQVEGISDYAYNRARGFEHALSRIEQSQQLYDTYHPQGYTPTIHWVANGEKGSQQITPNLLRGMGKIAATLFEDLRQEGEGELAIDLLDQHRPPMDDGETTQTPELP